MRFIKVETQNVLHLLFKFCFLGLASQKAKNKALTIQGECCQKHVR